MAKCNSCVPCYYRCPTCWSTCWNLVVGSFKLPGHTYENDCFGLLDGATFGDPGDCDCIFDGRSGGNGGTRIIIGPTPCQVFLQLFNPSNLGQQLAHYTCLPADVPTDCTQPMTLTLQQDFGLCKGMDGDPNKSVWPPTVQVTCTQNGGCWCGFWHLKASGLFGPGGLTNVNPDAITYDDQQYATRDVVMDRNLQCAYQWGNDGDILFYQMTPDGSGGWLFEVMWFDQATALTSVVAEWQCLAADVPPACGIRIPATMTLALVYDSGDFSGWSSTINVTPYGTCDGMGVLPS